MHLSNLSVAKQLEDREASLNSTCIDCTTCPFVLAFTVLCRHEPGLVLWCDTQRHQSVPASKNLRATTNWASFLEKQISGTIYNLRSD